MLKRSVLCLALLAMLVPLAAFAVPNPAASCRAANAETVDFSTWHMPVVISNKSGCNANVTCPGGQFISCSSGVPGTCTAGATFVICNGVRTDCPPPPTCSEERECCDGGSVYCEGTTCSLTARGVRCDGITYNCPRCPILP